MVIKKSNRALPQKIVEAALELTRAGVSERAASAQLSKRFKRKVSAAAVGKWKRDAAALAEVEDDAPPSSVAPAPAVDPQPDLPVETPEDDGAPIDVYEHTRKAMRRSQRLAEQAAADGNHAAAQKAQRDVLGYSTILARLEKERRSDEERLFTREELEAARRSINDRVTKLVEDVARTGGLVCSHCGREIRVRLAKGE